MGLRLIWKKTNGFTVNLKKKTWCLWKMMLKPRFLRRKKLYKLTEVQTEFQTRVFAMPFQVADPKHISSFQKNLQELKVKRKRLLPVHTALFSPVQFPPLAHTRVDVPSRVYPSWHVKIHSWPNPLLVRQEAGDRAPNGGGKSASHWIAETNLVSPVLQQSFGWLQ